jgi:diacylglycerol kinase (ATP)
LIVALVNPASGAGQGRDRLTCVEKACADAGVRIEVVETAGPGDVTRSAAEAAARRPAAIALIGGDGSVGELCRAYVSLPADRRPPLVLVPAGRGNSFYKAIMSDAPWEEYVRRAIARPYVRNIDVGCVEETGDTWALGVSLGYLHDCVVSTRFFPGLRGRTLYAAAGAYAAARVSPFRVEVAVDGVPVYAGRSVLAAAGGGPFRGGRLHLFPTSDLTDGLLDVCVIEAVGTRRFAEILRAGTAGSHVEMPDVHCFQGRRVAFRAEQMRCELDGTVFAVPGDTLTLSCLAGALPVAFPLWNWDDVPVSPAPV